MTIEEALDIAVEMEAIGQETELLSLGRAAVTLVVELRRLRTALRVNAMRWGVSDGDIDAVLYRSAQTKAADPKAGG